MAKRLTALAVENARPRATSYEVKDASSPLRLVVHPSGKRAWITRYRRPDGRTAKLTHERFVPLVEARRWAAEAMAELAAGRDPGVLQREAAVAEQKAAAERAGDTVAGWAARFIERHVEKNTGATNIAQARHVFDDIVLPAWPGRTVHDIKRRDVIELVESVAEDRPVMANRMLAHLSRFFNWLCERDVIAASPCGGVKRPAKEKARDRTLNDDEIKRLWAACDAIGDPAGSCIKVLLLTGQRRSEVAGMRRSEINGELWSLGPSRTKNKKAHDVPLSAQALALVESMPNIGDYVFTASGTAPLNNFDRAKREIDALMKPTQPFVFHDLRRTAASGLQRLGVQLQVIEKVLNHTSGSFRGIVAVYQRHSFDTEKRIALQKWAAHVDALVRGESAGNVIALARR
jgi:integrase